MNTAVDWTTAPGNWPEIGPEIAASLKRIATMPLDQLRAMPELPLRPWRCEPSIADIQTAVCQEFEITRAEMLSAIQSRKITIPRQIAMYLAREITHKTFGEIARSFDRDYSTISFGCDAIARRPELASVIARLWAELAP